MILIISHNYNNKNNSNNDDDESKRLKYYNLEKVYWFAIIFLPFFSQAMKDKYQQRSFTLL